MLRLTVIDEDLAINDFVGEFSIPVSSVRPGMDLIYYS